MFFLFFGSAGRKRQQTSSVFSDSDDTAAGPSIKHKGIGKKSKPNTSASDVQTGSTSGSQVNPSTPERVSGPPFLRVTPLPRSLTLPVRVPSRSHSISSSVVILIFLKLKKLLESS